jgi:hypothetical protein
VSALTADDIKMFDDFRIPRELLELHQIERVSDEEARTKHGILGDGDMAGIALPYLFVPGCNGFRVSSAVRRDKPEIENGKAKNKYMRAWGDAAHLFSPTIPRTSTIPRASSFSSNHKKPFWP